MTTIQKTESQIASLIRRSRNWNAKQLDQAELSYKQYTVINCLGFAGDLQTVSMQRVGTGAHMVKVNVAGDTCSCAACLEGGEVHTMRQDLLNLGYDKTDLMNMFTFGVDKCNVWPQCRHLFIVVLLEMEYPEVFDPFGNMGRNAEQVERWRVGQYTQDAIMANYPLPPAVYPNFPSGVRVPVPVVVSVPGKKLEW